MTGIIYLFALIFLFSAAVLFVFKRFSHPSIPAYIIAGILGSFFISEGSLFELLKWGIVFVVFIFGAKMKPKKLKHGIDASVLSVSTHIAALGICFFIIFYYLGLEFANSIFISAALVLSSSLTGTELSESYATIELLFARLANSIDIIHDIIAIFLILMLSPILFDIGIGYSLAVGVGMLGIALVFRKFIFPKLFEFTESSEELILLLGISMLAFMVSIAQITGISIIVGAFFAGIAFSYFPYNIELVESMESFKDFFAAIYFFILGALITVPNIMSLFVTILILLVTIIVKPLLTAFSMMNYGYDKRTAYRCAMTLDQVSEFVLIIIVQAYLVGAIDTFVFQGIILATTITMITTSYTDTYSSEIVSWLSNKIPVNTPENVQKSKTRIQTNLKNHVILLGYDVQGKVIGNFLREKEKEFVVIEINPEKLESAENLENYIFKSAKDKETWEMANYKKADLIISTPPQKHVSEEVINLETDAKKIVRSGDLKQAAELLDRGADYVMVYDLLASEQLIDYVEEVMYNKEETLKKIRRVLLEDLKKGMDKIEE